jgi:S-formylglutathione hydrolase FrmB
VTLAGASTSATAAPGATVSPTPAPPTPTPFPTPQPPPAGVSASRLEYHQFASATLGRTMPYYIFLPPGYNSSPDQRFPVLYMLHGLSGAAEEWRWYGIVEDAGELMDTGAIQPYIIVLPQGDQGYWVNQAGPEGERWGDYLAGDLVDYIDATYRTLPSPASRAVGGLSMGGFGALSLGLTQPDVFGVVGAHSPSLHPADTAPPFLVGDDPAIYQAVDPFALAERVDPAAAPRVWIDVGDADLWLVRGEEVRQALDQRGLAVDYVVTPGDHDDIYWSAQAASYLRFYGSALRSE